MRIHGKSLYAYLSGATRTTIPSGMLAPPVTVQRVTLCLSIGVLKRGFSVFHWEGPASAETSLPDHCAFKRTFRP